jgi:hypothetical protein
MTLHKGTVQRVGVTPLPRKNSSSSNPLKTLDLMLWWMDTCPWHGQISTLRLRSSAMLGACLLDPYGAI